MSNSNVIARLYSWPPHNRLASETIKRSRFAAVQSHDLSVAASFGRNNRLVTPVDPSSHATLDTLLSPHIQISFHTIPKTSHGIVFGCDRGSDVVLPDAGGVSAYHFSLNFDDQHRLVVRDLNSTAGTEVSFSGSGRHNSGKMWRRNFRWLVEGSSRMPSSEVVIHVGASLSFRLELDMNCCIPQDVYASKVERFRRGSGASQALFQSVNRRLRRSRFMNDAVSLSRDPIYREEFLAKGGCGTAKYMWDVSTGQEMVLKEPIAEQVRSVDERCWKAEAQALKSLCHENILKLLRAELCPRPRLLLEYCPGGTLSDVAHELGASDILQVLQQCLSGLQFAHKAGIVHRDLKHDNILIASRSPLKIKIADFGLAKIEDQLQTVCGTYPFMAPEIWAMQHPTEAKYYTKAVDIWALGAVVYDLLFGLPHGFGLQFCLRIVRDLHARLEAHRGTIAEFLANYMLKPRGENRSSAAACYRAAMALPKTPSDHVERVWGPPQRISFYSVKTEEKSVLSELGSLSWALGAVAPASSGARKRAAADDTESAEVDYRPRKRQISGKQCQGD